MQERNKLELDVLSTFKQRYTLMWLLITWSFITFSLKYLVIEYVIFKSPQFKENLAIIATVTITVRKSLKMIEYS